MKTERNAKTKLKGKCENPQDIKNFDTLVGLMLVENQVKSVDILIDVFGEGFRTFLMREDMDMIISSKEVSANCIIFYIWGENYALIFY